MTLSKQDVQYSSYLKGTFSDRWRAIPQRPADSRMDTNFMTFRLLDVEKVQRPAFWRVWWIALRPNLLTLTLSPCLATWGVFAGLGSEATHIPAWQGGQALLALVLFQMSLHLLNDYFDHMSGKDRAADRTGSRIIQVGWLPAYSLFRTGVILLGFSVILALPILWKQTWLAWVVALAAAAGGSLFTLQSRGRLWPGVQEVVLLFLTGPLLTSGFYNLLFAGWSWSVFGLGLLFGLLAVAAFHLNCLEEIFLSSRVGETNLASALGFERSKGLIYGLLFAAGVDFLVLSLDPQLRLLSLTSGLLFVILVRSLIVRIRRSASFVSSRLHQVRYAALRIHWVLGIFLCVGGALLHSLP